MTQDLFRREVLEARRGPWLGGVSLAQPLHMWWLTLAAGLMALLVGLFLGLGTYTRRSTVTGQLVPAMGLATVVAPAAGVIGRIDVPEGGRVEEGQVLAVVATARATLAHGDMPAALQSRLERRREGLGSGLAARLQLLDAQGEGLRAQLAAAERELVQIRTGIGNRREQARIAAETLRSLRGLEDERYVSLLQIRQHESEALSWQGEVQALERQATATRRTVAQLRQALRELPGQKLAAEAGYLRDVALLEQEEVESQARGGLAIHAPVAGVVSAQLAKPGQSVQAGQPVLALLPGAGTLEAEFLVPSRAIGFIRPGDRVLLRYQAYPYQKFGHHEAEVARISRSALEPGGPGGSHAHEPLYRVTAKLARQEVMAYGREEPLKPGTLVDADILGERRRLIEWILEPLFTVRGRVGSA